MSGEAKKDFAYTAKSPENLSHKKYWNWLWARYSTKLKITHISHDWIFSGLLDYCFGYLKEKHCPKNESLAIFSGSNHGAPGLTVLTKLFLQGYPPHWTIHVLQYLHLSFTDMFDCSNFLDTWLDKCRLCEIRRSRQTCLTHFENVSPGTPGLSDKMSTKVIIFAGHFQCKMTDENPKCLTKNPSFVRQNDQRGAKFSRTLQMSLGIPAAL